jgi:hypothetical protein
MTNRNNQSSWISFVLLSVLCILTFFFRFYNLSATPPGLYPDEAMNGNNALEALSPQGHFKVFYPENGGREALFINIQAFFLKLFGVREPWALRFASGIFGSLAVIGLYFLIREFLHSGASRRLTKLQASAIAFAGSFLMSISFWHVNFSRIGFRAIMAPTFLIWATYVLLKGLAASRRSAQWALLALAGAIYGLGMHSYIAYRATPLFIAFFFVLYKYWYAIPWKKIGGQFAFFFIGGLLTALPLLAYFVQNPQDFFGRTSQISVFNSGNALLTIGENILKTLGMFFIYGDPNWRHNFSGAPELFWLTAAFMVLGIIMGIRTTAKKLHMKDAEAFTFLACAGWFAVALLPTIISNEGIPHALRSILMIPPVFIVAGLGAWHAYQFARKHADPRVLRIGIALIAAGMIAQAYVQYFIVWGQNPNVAGEFTSSYVALGRELNAIPNDIPKYVIVNIGGFDVRGLPMSTQTVMFMTDTFTPEKQAAKNLHYVLEKDEASITDPGAAIFYLKQKES